MDPSRLGSGRAYPLKTFSGTPAEPRRGQVLLCSCHHASSHMGHKHCESVCEPVPYWAEATSCCCQASRRRLAMVICTTPGDPHLHRPRSDAVSPHKLQHMTTECSLHFTVLPPRKMHSLAFMGDGMAQKRSQ